jgi:hypothetical protein
MSMSGIAPIAAPAEQSSVSWPAIFAGGVTAAAISIILLLFGTGLGLAAISPWAGSGISAGSFTVLAAIWLVIVQWVASLFGGYMAGRLRTKWTDLHTDEVFFRDTAHGFLAWALGTLIVAGVIAAAGSSSVKGTAQIAQASAAAAQNSYYVDELFRVNAVPAGASASSSAINPAPQPSGAPDQQMRAEAASILAHSAAAGSVSPADNDYLAQLVSEHTGLALADAEARVQSVVSQDSAEIVKAKQVADAGRKASSALSIYTFVSMLIGAFIASVAGAIGGRLRDNY